MGRKVLKDKKGFSLIEIVVVLIIVGIAAAIALPSYFNWVTNSQASEAVMTLKSIGDAIEACMSANNNPANCAGTAENGCAGVTSPNFTYSCSSSFYTSGGPAYPTYMAEAQANNAPLTGVQINCGIHADGNPWNFSKIMLVYNSDGGTNPNGIRQFCTTGAFKGVI